MAMAFRRSSIPTLEEVCILVAYQMMTETCTGFALSILLSSNLCHCQTANLINYLLFPIKIFDTAVHVPLTMNEILFGSDDVNDNSTMKMKQFVLSNISNAPKHVSDVVERTGLDSVSCVPLKIRLPWKVLFANIVKDNVCVLGDALHPMTPDLGQGGCSALEDSVVLASCIAEALGTNSTLSGTGKEEGCNSKIEIGLQKYANDRKWRSFGLISMAYIVGWVQEKEGVVMSFLRKLFLARLSIRAVVRMADFDFGKFSTS